MMIKQQIQSIFFLATFGSNSQDVPCAGLNASRAAGREALQEVLRQTCGFWVLISIPQ